MNGYKEEFSAKDGILYVRLSGKFPQALLRNLENLFQPLAEACSTHNCRKALIDATDLQPDLDTLGLFRAGADLPSMTNLGLRIAMVARKDMLDPLFEDVALNRGGIVGVFTEIDAAREWLQKFP